MTAEEEAKGGEKKTTWTTWEELLLSCAVKRHGLKDWDSVTMEIQTRTSPSNLFTPQICRNKYHELRHRFRDHHDEPPAADHHDDEDSIPWIEELRKLRVAELTQEVQRYDLSIQSLQLKVKRLEEEHEHSLKENEEKDDEKPDLEMDSQTNRSENDKIDADGEPATVSPADTAGKEVSGEHSDRSFNESNSSENRDKTGGGRESESEPVQTGGDVKPDPRSKTVREDSCNDSSDTVAKYLATKSSHKEKDSDELLDSEAAESKDGTKDSSDVQSSASLTKKKRRKPGEVSRGGGNGGGGGSSKEELVVVSPATTTTTTIKRDVVVKSEPLVAVMDIIRSHKHGSLFERRLESQKTEKYNKIVRQHVDLRIVQTRIDDGSYSSCFNKFYLDLLLIFNNAIVYFPKSSAESMAAHELRTLVLKEMRKKRIHDRKKSDSSLKSEPAPLRPKPELERSDSLLAKQKSAAPIVVCRKRSSISGKPSSSSKAGEKEAIAKPLVIPKPPVKTSSNEEEGSMKMKMKEKLAVTGARSMRRSGNSNRSNSTTNVGPSKNQMTSSSSNLGNATSKGSDVHGHSRGHAAPAKVDKVKVEVTPVVKKRGAADFLKRIKKNSPGKGIVAETLRNTGSAEDGGGGGGGGSRKDQVKKKVEERKDGMTGRQKSGSNGGGGGGGKLVKEDISPSKRGVGRPPKKGKEVVPVKRGREPVEPDSASKRPTKRSRR